MRKYDYGGGNYYGVNKLGRLVVDVFQPNVARSIQRDPNGVYSIYTGPQNPAIAEDWGLAQGTFEDNSITYEIDGETQTYVVENGNCEPTPPDFS